jgi:hypothetical protein
MTGMPRRFAVLAFVFALACLLDLPFAARADDAPASRNAVLEAVEGADSIVASFKKETRDVPAGKDIYYGETLETDGATTALLRYPDGSHLLLEPRTRFLVEAKVVGESGDQQWNRLVTGQVRGVIVKSKGEPPKRPRFLIRTRTATMGVRGTEFVMSFDAAGGGAQVHTLEGVVEVGRDETAVMSGQGTQVAEGRFVEATSSGLSPPQPFDKADFLKSLGAGSGGAGAGGSAASGASGALGAGGGFLGGLLGGAAKAAAADRAAPAPQQQQPPPQPKLLPPQQKNEKNGQPGAPLPPPEEPDRRTKIGSVELGILYIPQAVDGNTYRSLSAFWTPTLGLPSVRFLSMRGNLGAHFAGGGSIDSKFYVPEFQLSAVATIFGVGYVEAGGGKQFWWHGGPDAAIGTAKFGLQLSKGGLINRVFIGYTREFVPGENTSELRAGIGLNFF